MIVLHHRLANTAPWQYACDFIIYILLGRITEQKNDNKIRAGHPSTEVEENHVIYIKW